MHVVQCIGKICMPLNYFGRKIVGTSDVEQVHLRPASPAVWAEAR
jgi:hypothetical protein